MAKKLFFIALSLLLLNSDLLFAATEISVSSGLSVVLSEKAGHSVPAVDYLRRLDRVFRQVGKIPAGTGSGKLRLELSDRIAPGEWRWGKNPERNAFTLMLPADYTSWGKYPRLGRTLVSAILQTRLGNRADEPLPPAALWIADGLWAEFVQREADGERIFRFLWLNGLRNVVEAGGRITFSPENLTPPAVTRPGAVAWELYLERSRLLLDVASRLGGKGNVLKDYLSMLERSTLTPEAAFDRTIGDAAVKKLSNLAPGYAKLLPTERHAAATLALEKLAERALFSIYAPLSANAVAERLTVLQKIPYQRDDGYAATAELSDLPLLAEKYESCRDLPRQKIGEINELLTVVPQEFRLPLVALSAALDRIGSVPTDRAAKDVKESWTMLMQKLRERQQVEAALEQWEKSYLPPLEQLHYFLDAPPGPNQVSPRIDEALDRAEQEL